MKKILLLAAAILAAPLAHADYRPIVQNRYYTASASVGGGTVSYQQSWLTGGALTTVANNIVGLSGTLQSAINAQLDKKLREEFSGYLIEGTLTGPYDLHLYPVSGYVRADLTGPTYVGIGRATKKQLGITVSCQVTVKLTNFSVRAQFGSTDGETTNENLGVSADTSTSSICDSSIDWIPVFGDLLNNFIEGKVNDLVADGVKGYFNGLADKLFFVRDANFKTLLDSAIENINDPPLPTGGTFPLRQFVRDNVPYLLSGADMRLTLGTWAPVVTRRGTGEPHENVLVGTLLNWTVSSQAVNFNVNLTDTAIVSWAYQCPAGSKTCQIP